MPPRVRTMYVVMLLALLLIPALGLIRELSRRSDIWWTPTTMAVPLSESAKRVEVLVRGRALRPLVDGGHLRIATDSAAPVISAGDITFRFNNWDRVRAQRIPVLLVYAAVFGALVTMLIILLTGRLAYREEIAERRV